MPTYTYSDNPNSSGTTAQKRDAVRWLIQDTNTALGKVSDAEIAFTLVEEANVYAAAARCCEVLVAAAGSVKNRTVGSTSVSYDVAFYEKLAKTLREKARGQYEAPFCGGISVADKDTTESDSDRVAPDFFKGMHEFQGTSQPTTTEGAS